MLSCLSLSVLFILAYKTDHIRPTLSYMHVHMHKSECVRTEVPIAERRVRQGGEGWFEVFSFYMINIKHQFQFHNPSPTKVDTLNGICEEKCCFCASMRHGKNHP